MNNASALPPGTARSGVIGAGEWAAVNHILPLERRRHAEICSRVAAFVRTRRVD